MRTIIFSLIALSFMVPAAFAAEKPKHKAAKKVVAVKAKPNRDIANKLPSRVLTFVCRELDGGQENVMGLTQMGIDLRDETTGSFAASLYLRTEKGYLPKIINGTYTTVPGGFVMRTKWTGILGEYTILHIHAAEKTQFPGINNKQTCEVTAQLVSN